MTLRQRRARLRVDVLTDLRARRHLTVPQLAAATGISRSHLLNVEHGAVRDGRPRSMSLTDLAILADFYGVALDTLVELVDCEPVAGASARADDRVGAP